MLYLDDRIIVVVHYTVCAVDHESLDLSGDQWLRYSSAGYASYYFVLIDDGVGLSVAAKRRQACRDDASMDLLDCVYAKDYRGSGRAVGSITDPY